jgi:hypothetical protein
MHGDTAAGTFIDNEFDKLVDTWQDQDAVLGGSVGLHSNSVLPAALLKLTEGPVEQQEGFVHLLL